MSLQGRTEYWLECDADKCRATYGVADDYDDYVNLEHDAEGDGWGFDEETHNWYCEDHAIKLGLGPELSPIQQVRQFICRVLNLKGGFVESSGLQRSLATLHSSRHRPPGAACTG